MMASSRERERGCCWLFSAAAAACEDAADVGCPLSSDDAPTAEAGDGGAVLLWDDREIRVCNAAAQSPIRLGEARGAEEEVVGCPEGASGQHRRGGSRTGREDEPIVRRLLGSPLGTATCAAHRPAAVCALLHP